MGEEQVGQSETPAGGGEDGAIVPPNDSGPPRRREWEQLHSVEPPETIRVLHVDDDPALLDVTEEFLQREDDRITVETVTDPTTGLEHLAESRFDVVVSDYEMPEMTGLTFLKRLRERGDEIPFIVFTGQSREEIAVDALNLGADRYLQKGSDPKSQYGLLADAIVQETRLNRAEAALRESEERYRSLVEAFPDIVFITDYESRMLWANDALERQTGLTVEDFQMTQEENPFIHPDDAERVAQHIAEFVESDRKYSEPVDNKFVDADGTVHWYSSILVKTAYDDQPALQFITRNITERKERERRLARVQRRHRSLVGAVPDGLVAFVDSDCRYHSVGGPLFEQLPFDPGTIEGRHVDSVDESPLGTLSEADCRKAFDGEHVERTVDGSVTIQVRPVSDDGAVPESLVLAQRREG